MAAKKKPVPKAKRAPAPTPSSPKPGSALRISHDELATLFRLMERRGITELAYEDVDMNLRIARGAKVTAAPVVEAHAQPAEAAPAARGGEKAAEPEDVSYVTSPFVGTFYRAATPESPAFVEVGSVVQPGQTLCIVEAMKMFNQIEADEAGTITAVLVENGKAVEFGQRLFAIQRPR